MKLMLLALRIIFGAWMLASGVNHLFFNLWAEPTGSQPLSMQLMAAFQHSGLMTVASIIQLVTGALILIGVFTPAALCVVMPVSVCAAYWAVVLEHEPALTAVAVAMVGLNGLLMLAYLDYYKDALQRRALTLGEA